MSTLEILFGLLAVMAVVGAAVYNRKLERIGGQRLLRARRNGAIIGLAICVALFVGLGVVIVAGVLLDRGSIIYTLLFVEGLLLLGVIASWRRYKRRDGND